MQPEGSDNKEKFIVELLRQGNDNAFNSLFRDYGKRLYHFSYGYLKSREDAEEIVQEVFIRVWESRAALDASQTFSGFVFTIAYRLILNRLRRRRNEVRGKMYWQQRGVFVSNETEERVIYEDLGGFARAAIAALPPKRKVIYRLIREDHMTYQEVADRLNISVKTVEAHMAEALRFLRQRILLHVVLPLTAFLFL